MTVVAATFATLQDGGRPTGSWWGIATNGAPDQHSYRFANALLGNVLEAVCLETVMSDLVVRFEDETLIAVTGATARVVVDGLAATTYQAVRVPAGAEVAIRDLHEGTRSYLAVLGGFIAPETFLGSASPDRTLGFGLALLPGTTVDHACAPSDMMRRAYPFGLPRIPTSQPCTGAMVTLEVLPGENADLFEDAAGDVLRGTYRLTDKTDAVGSRLSGPVPRRVDEREILSRALPIGSIEVTGGELLVLNRGRGLSAGYPVVGVITGPSMDTLSQAQPGTPVRFAAADEEAAARHRRRLLVELEETQSRMRRVLDPTPCH